ncbi:FlgB family protein [Actibacterium sp. 188UL27-1]|uniref:FlgB family protein n=1 Tax=Actibacterium sp. 188UL27-1 TaxID=2786961 RepID=UPI00195BF179|nr:FlgB family protein [Actibacterium sp. 188UL27-1]MBM7066204.1 FlgB family protein [Actibacterium sp. 188UL27-1]
MFDKLEIFQLAGGMARHAGARQNVIARNLANTDTPGFKSQDISSFARSVDGSSDTGLRASRVGHLTDASAAGGWRVSDAGGGSNAPNGNSVSLEGEMVKAAETQQQHTTAISIYRSAIDILSTSLGRR